MDCQTCAVFQLNQLVDLIFLHLYPVALDAVLNDLTHRHLQQVQPLRQQTEQKEKQEKFYNYTAQTTSILFGSLSLFLFPL